MGCYTGKKWEWGAYRAAALIATFLQVLVPNVGFDGERAIAEHDTATAAEPAAATAACSHESAKRATFF